MHSLHEVKENIKMACDSLKPCYAFSIIKVGSV